LKFSSWEDSNYLGDDIILALTMQCPNVELFYDEQAYGVTKRAISHMSQGWKNLKTLILNTEMKHITPLFNVLGLFKGRLKCLGIQHFHDDLKQHFGEFLLGLSCLPGLETFILDLSMSWHTDGLNAAHFHRILKACPSIKQITYKASLESYFDDNTEEYPMLGILRPMLPPTLENLSLQSPPQKKLDIATIPSSELISTDLFKTQTLQLGLLFDEIRQLCKSQGVDISIILMD